MLFNPKWSNDEITLDNFLAYCESRAPRARYYYSKKPVCAVGRFLQDSGHGMLLYAHWGCYPVIYKADQLACSCPHTFGALAKRIREFKRRDEIPF